MCQGWAAAGARGSHWQALLEISVTVNSTSVASFPNDPRALRVTTSVEAPMYTVFSNVLVLLLSALVATVFTLYVFRIREHLNYTADDTVVAGRCGEGARPWPERLLPEQLAVAGAAAALIGYLSPLSCATELLMLLIAPSSAGSAGAAFPAVPEVPIAPPTTQHTWTHTLTLTAPPPGTVVRGGGVARIGLAGAPVPRRPARRRAQIQPPAGAGAAPAAALLPAVQPVGGGRAIGASGGRGTAADDDIAEYADSAVADAVARAPQPLR
jgi:hypothetical protein